MKAMVAVAVVVAFILFYYIVDPGCVWMPHCIVKTYTGLDCPGCGSQRAVHALLHGDISGAFRYNAFLFVALLYIVVVGIAQLCDRRLYAALTSARAAYSVLVAVIVWCVVRNVAGI